MAFSFKNIHFDIIDGNICLQSIGNVSALKPSAFSEIQIAGGNKDNHLGVKQDNLSEKLEYVEKKE
ncbi:MAG: hypothetical protein MJ193_04720 [Clostridia bacterium]|nr:hypothetical protein [Clostridia bacterium]